MRCSIPSLVNTVLRKTVWMFRDKKTWILWPGLLKKLIIWKLMRDHRILTYGKMFFFLKLISLKTFSFLSHNAYRNIWNDLEIRTIFTLLRTVYQERRDGKFETQLWCKCVKRYKTPSLASGTLKHRPKNSSHQVFVMPLLNRLWRRSMIKSSQWPQLEFLEKDYEVWNVLSYWNWVSASWLFSSSIERVKPNFGQLLTQSLRIFGLCLVHLFPDQDVLVAHFL